MQKANAASVPRSEKVLRKASCAPTAAVGNCVRVTGPRVGNVWSVGVSTSSDLYNSPAVGIIISKESPTLCTVQFHGPTGAVTGLIPGAQYFVGSDGFPAAAGDGNYPTDGAAVFQQIGIATSDDELLIQPLAGSLGEDPGGYFTRVANAAIGGHRVVVADGADGVIVADPTDATHLHRILGITVGAAILGDDIAVRYSGDLIEGSWSWTPNAPVYCGASGVLTQTAPVGVAWWCIVAVAVSATALVVGLREPIRLA